MSLASRAAALGKPASNSPATPSSQGPGSIPSWQQKRVGQALNVSGNDTASASPDQPLPDNSDGGSADGANSNTPKPAGQTAGSVVAARSGVASWASRNTTASISGTASAGLNINKSGAVSFGGKTGGLLSGISSKVLTSSSSSSAVGGAAAVSATAASPSVPAWKQKAAATAAASTTNTSGATPQSTGSSSSSALSKFGSAASSASTSTTAASSSSASAGGSKWGANRAVASSTTTASTAGPSSVGSSNKFGAGKLGVGSSTAGGVGGKGPTTAVGPAAASSDGGPGSSDAAASAAPPAPPTAEEVALLRTELAEAKDTILRLLERCEALTIERDEEVSRAIEQYTSDRPVDPWMALSSRVALDTTVLLAQAAATMGTGSDFDSGSSNSYSDDLINRIMSKSMEYTSRCAATSAEQRALAEASEVGWEWAAMGLRSQLGRHGGSNSSFDDGGGGGLDVAVAASIVPSDGGGGVGQSDLTPGIAQPRAAAGAAAGHFVPSASPAADAALPFATSGSPRLTAAQPPVVGSPRRSSTPPRPPSVRMATPAAADSSSSDSSVAGHAAVTSPVAHDPLKWILESSSPPEKQASSSALTSVPLSAEHLISGSTASADTILACRLDLIGLGTHASDLTATLASLDSIGRDPATGELTQEAVQALAELEASMQFGVEQPAVP